MYGGFHNQSEVRNQLQKSLENLDISYIDLYMLLNTNDCLTPEIHPTRMIDEMVHENLFDTYQSMENFVENGKVRSLGLSEFDITQLRGIVSNANIKPVVYQFHVWPLYNQLDYTDFCRSHEIIMTDIELLGFKDEVDQKNNSQFIETFRRK